MTSAQCVIGTEKYPDSSILLNYNDDEYSQEHDQIKEASRVPTKDDILNPYITDHHFRSSNEGNDIGYKLYIFVVQYQKKPKICLNK